ncbi:MAG: hypothetical protein ACRDRL_21695 [Sciscionella sp.]
MLEDLPAEQRYPVVMGIQVFQHGDQDTAHAHLAAAAALVEPGGLLAIRVNATDTDIAYDHARLDHNQAGGFSITYHDGPKAGLNVHFVTDTELTSLLGDDFHSVLPPRLHSTSHLPLHTGQWSQWEPSGDGTDPRLPTTRRPGHAASSTDMMEAAFPCAVG